MNWVLRGRGMVVVAAGSALVFPAATLAAAPHHHSARHGCRAVADRDRDWEVAFGQFRSRAAAARLQRRTDAKGLRATIERNGCGSFEVAVTHLRGRTQAASLMSRARKEGFHASIRRS